MFGKTTALLKQFLGIDEGSIAIQWLPPPFYKVRKMKFAIDPLYRCVHSISNRLQI